MILQGFEGPFSQSKSITNRFQVELAMKCAPRRLKTAPRRAQDAPQGAGTVAGTRLCRAKDFRKFRTGLNKQSEKFEAPFVSFVSIGFRFDPALK